VPGKPAVSQPWAVWVFRAFLPVRGVAMDCRVTLCVGCCLLAASLAGCAPDNQATQPSGAEAAPPVAQAAPVHSTSQLDFELEKPEASKHLQPGTMVALGDFRLTMANDPLRTQDDKDQVLEDARVAYTRALGIDANCVAAHIGLARYFDMKNKPDEALASYDTALKLAPHEAGLWFEVGVSQMRRKAWEPALARLQKAAEMQPDNRRFVSAYAVSLARANRAEESLAWLTKIYSEAEARLNLARTMHLMQADDVSRAYLQQALKIDPNLEAAKDLLAQLDAATSPAAPANSPQ
jgi:tetratricopeptide (TPR) repeat protein